MPTTETEPVLLSDIMQGIEYRAVSVYERETAEWDMAQMQQDGWAPYELGIRHPDDMSIRCWVFVGNPRGLAKLALYASE